MRAVVVKQHGPGGATAHTGATAAAAVRVHLRPRVSRMKCDRGGRAVLAAHAAQYALADQAGDADDGLERPGAPGTPTQHSRERAAAAGIDAVAAETAFTTAEVHMWPARAIAFEEPARTIVDTLPAACTQHREQILGNRPWRTRQGTTRIDVRIS